jgi:hypothetical protein
MYSLNDNSDRKIFQCLTIHLCLTQEVDLPAEGVAEISSEKLCIGKMIPLLVKNLETWD